MDKTTTAGASARQTIFRRAFRVLRLWWQASQTTHALSVLDDALLNDIGLCRSEILFHARAVHDDGPRNAEQGKYRSQREWSAL